MKEPTFRLSCVISFLFALSAVQAGDRKPLADTKSPVVEDTLEIDDRADFRYGPIAVYTDYAERILDWQEDVVAKPLIMLQERGPGGLEANTLTVSGAYWGSYMYEETNVEGKFPILSRFPNQHSGSSGSRWITNNAAIGLTASVGDWITVYAQGEYSEIEFLGQDEYQLRKIFGMIGNLDAFPVYAYVGRNTVDFGLMNAYNPFTHSVNNHFFRIDSEDAVVGLGYADHGFHFIATLIPSGRQLRVADTLDDNATFGNFALNGTYEWACGEWNGRIGGGYLYSSIYNRDVPHHPGAGFAPAVEATVDERRNGAWDVFAEIAYGPFTLGAEYTASTRNWPATAHLVTALNVQVAYDFELFHCPSRISAVYGFGRTGPKGTEFEKLSQFVLGFETQVLRNLSLGIEYVRNEDFVPLIGITAVSDSSVATDTLVVGGKFTF